MAALLRGKRRVRQFQITFQRGIGTPVWLFGALVQRDQTRAFIPRLGHGGGNPLHRFLQLNSHRFFLPWHV